MCCVVLNTHAIHTDYAPPTTAVLIRTEPSACSVYGRAPSARAIRGFLTTLFPLQVCINISKVNMHKLHRGRRPSSDTQKTGKSFLEWMFVQARVRVYILGPSGNQQDVVKSTVQTAPIVLTEHKHCSARDIHKSLLKTQVASQDIWKETGENRCASN